MEKLARDADVLAIPCFLIMFLYFLYKRNKTYLEWFLLLFALAGLVLDSIFTLKRFDFRHKLHIPDYLKSN